MRKWDGTPVYTLEAILGTIDHMLCFADGVDRFAVCKALLMSDNWNPGAAVEPITAGENAMRLSMQEWRERFLEVHRENTRKRLEKNGYQKTVQKARAAAINQLLSLDVDELLATRERWLARQGDPAKLMKQTPRGLGVNSPD